MTEKFNISARRILHDLKNVSYLMDEGARRFREAKISFNEKNLEQVTFLISEGQKRYHEASAIIDNAFTRETRAERLNTWCNSDRPQNDKK